MKYLRQLFIILTFTFIGESLNKLLPLPIPAGVYGLFLLLICLQMKWISLDSISGAGNFLLEIMPIMFIPASVGLITIYAKIADQIFFFIPYGGIIHHTCCSCYWKNSSVYHKQEKKER